MKWKNHFFKIDTEKLEEIQQEIQSILIKATDHYKNWSRFTREDDATGWMFIDKDTAVELTRKPKFSEWLKTHKIYPAQYSVVVVNEDFPPITPHADRGPNAKINFPVLNNQFWHNRWFDEVGNVIAETDLDLPIVFNSRVTHDVIYKGKTYSNINYPRIILAITMKNDELWEQKYLIN